jgi:hypothetical protein
MKNTEVLNMKNKNPSHWRTTLKKFLAPQQPEALPDTRSIELDDSTYALCREIANTQHISMKDAIAYIAHFYEEERSSQLRLRATDEQLAHNPLLALDMLISRAAPRIGGVHSDERTAHS